MLLRIYLQQCGGAFVKVGQILSTRLDLQGGQFHKELERLTDRASPVLFNVIQSTIEKDLSRPLADLYSEIDEKPLATASIAQVHRARLHSGQIVAVKVMRPFVKDDFSVDLFWFALIIRAAQALGAFSTLDGEGLIAEVKRVVRREHDFRAEGYITQLMHDLLESDRLDHAAPGVILSHCGSRVITMEYIAGISLNDLVNTMHRADDDSTPQLATGLNPRRVARILFRSFTKQVCHHRMVHADPHGANIIIQNSGTVTFVDFGIVGILDERSWEQQVAIFRALGSEDVHQAYRALLSLVEPLPLRNLSRLENEIKALLTDWVVAAQNPAAEFSAKSNGRLLLNCANVLRKNRLQMPWLFTAVVRTTVLADEFIYRLYPELNPVMEMKRFFDEEEAPLSNSLPSYNEAYGSIVQFLRSAMAVPNGINSAAKWLHTELPMYGRVYLREITNIERFVATLLLFAGYLIWALIIAIAVEKGLPLTGKSMSHWGPVEWLLERANKAVVACLIVLALLCLKLRGTLLDPSPAGE